MDVSIKQRLGNMAKKKQGGERYEKVQRACGSEEEEHEEEHEEERQASLAPPPAHPESSAVTSGGARALLARLHADVARSVYEAKHFPVDMYYVFALKFLESYSYFALSQILVLYLHEEFGVSDVEAGMVYGMWGAAITCGGLLVSWLNDNLGVKKSLCIGFSISMLSSLVVALTFSKTLLYITLFVLYPFGTAMGIPMLTVAVKRYTTAKNRGFAFGMYYSVMNMAALVSGPVVDGLYIGLKGKLSNGWSGYRIVILTCCFSNFLSLCISLRCLREINIEEESESADAAETPITSNTFSSPFHTPIKDNDSEGDLESEVRSSSSTLVSSSGIDQQGSAKSRVVAAYSPTKQHPCTTAKELCQSRTFWRFSILTLFLVNLHAIFRHLDATLPTYLVRCFGSDVPKGSLYSINPFMIIFLTPFVAACTNNSNHFDMIKWGGYVTAASPFILALDTSIAAVVWMLVVLSLGEAIWSPRLYDYVMTIAPEGREASFSALASAPLFAAKIPVGLMSGYLLHTYLPEEDANGDQPHQRPRTMWLIIGLMTITSPLLITMFDTCIREPSSVPKCDRDTNVSSTVTDCESASRSDRHDTHLEVGDMN